MLYSAFGEVAGILRVRGFDSAWWSWARQDLSRVSSTSRTRTARTDLVVGRDEGRCSGSGRRVACVTRGREQDEEGGVYIG
jgi:3-oxoacyl-ACP reductase-like protein